MKGAKKMKGTKLKLAMTGCLCALGASAMAAAGQAAEGAKAARTVEAALAQAHERLTGTFMGAEGLLLDYVGEIPTPKDCAELRPNGMGYWTPIENGPMFTGPYLAAMSEKARRSGLAEDRALCRRLAGGLVKAASVSDEPGMIVRGFSTDGKSHFPISSEDQTVPWFYGLHAYAMSGLPGPDERRALVAKVREVGEALAKVDWKCRCDGRFRGQSSGDIKTEHSLHFRGDAHYLFVLWAMYDVTGDPAWKARYEAACAEVHPTTGLTRVDTLAKGYVPDMKKFRVEIDGMWIYVTASGCLRRLSEADGDPARRAKYREGLRINAGRARKFFDMSKKYDNSTETPFRYANWRAGYSWREQKTQGDCSKVAATGKKEVLGTRKEFERLWVTAPLASCAVAAFSGDASLRPALAEVIRRYDYSTICLSEFFLAEVAWYALPAGN